MEIEKVLKIFAITIMIFGIMLIGTGVFAFMSNSSENEQTSVPVVTMSQNGNKITINVRHDKVIDKIYYSWNNEQAKILQGKGKNIITQEIDALAGTNTLYIKIVDIFGKESNYEKEYTVSSSDVTSPTIELLTVESEAKIKITAKDETELAYISYYWNDEDETKVEVNSNTPKIIEEKISILKGENTLTVVAVDKAENEETKEQTFKTAKKPNITLSKDGQNIAITVTDEENIKKVEIELNGQTYSTDASNTGEPLNRKELTLTLPLVAGNNSITVKAYNTNGLEKEETTQITLE